MGSPPTDGLPPRPRLPTKWTADLVAASGDLLPWDVLENGLRTGDLGAKDRAFKRFDLNANVVRAAFLQGNRTLNGRATNASVNGLFVEVDAKVALGDQLRVDLTNSDGEHQHFEARVARVTPKGFGLILAVGDASAAFRQRFVNQAKSPGAEPPAVLLQPLSARKPTYEIETSVTQLLLLHEMWSQLELRIEEDGVHQEFIHACLSHQRLEYALARYQELANVRPDLPLAEHYLHQIGTILRFSNSQQKRPDEEATWQRKVFGLLLVVSVIVIGAIWVAQVSSANKLAQRNERLAKEAASEVYGGEFEATETQRR